MQDTRDLDSIVDIIVKRILGTGNIPVEVSGRHVHLSEQDLFTLFGKGYKFRPKRDLSQPGQFLCEERVDIIGPKVPSGTLPFSVRQEKKPRLKYQ